jgi:hypothetical protein
VSSDLTTGTNDHDVRIAWIHLAKGVAWPVVFLVAFLSISGSIAGFVGRTSSIFDRANTVQFGELTIQMDREIASRASPEIKSTLSNLNSSQLSILFNMPSIRRDVSDVTSSKLYLLSSISIVCKIENRYEDIIEMIEIGLLDKISEDDLNMGEFFDGLLKDENCISYKLTSMGQRIKEFLITVVDSAFAELSSGSKYE